MCVQIAADVSATKRTTVLRLAKGIGEVARVIGEIATMTAPQN